jgi:hypothetical protein
MTSNSSFLGPQETGAGCGSTIASLVDGLSKQFNNVKQLVSITGMVCHASQTSAITTHVNSASSHK